MNLQVTLSMYGGGPGSGCNPAAGKCGRHAEVVDTVIYLPQYGMAQEVVLTENGSTVASGLLVQKKGLPGVAQVDSPEVPKALRGQGYGKELYRRLFKNAKKLGYKEVRSDIEDMRSPRASSIWGAMSKEMKIGSRGIRSDQYYYIKF
jgi:predicted GNAT family acetyltransferase